MGRKLCCCERGCKETCRVISIRTSGMVQTVLPQLPLMAFERPWILSTDYPFLFFFFLSCFRDYIQDGLSSRLRDYDQMKLRKGFFQ